MSAFVEKAPAKINLSLIVKGRRIDGYHELHSLVVFADCGDVLSADAAPNLSLAVTGPYAATLQTENNNLVLEAVSYFDEYCGTKTAMRLTLEKNLPVASGIGGGSADAAAALRLLCQVHGRALPSHVLSSLGLCIGADVPVCLGTQPAMMWGKGELISRLDGLPEFWLVLVNPGVAVSTGAVFAALNAAELPEKLAGPVLPQCTRFEALVAWLEEQGNDLERPAMTLAPVIADVIAALKTTRGCALARMSGSGATCFGLYADEASATRAAVAIRVVHPDWWVVSAKRL